MTDSTPIMSHRTSRRIRYLAAGAAGAMVVVAMLWLFNVGPFAPSIDDMVSESVGTSAKCKPLGLAEMAGARTKIYSCAVRLLGGDAVLCRAVVDGVVYVVGDDVYRGCGP